MSAFDQIDRRFRRPPVFKALEAFEEGDECPKPKCRGQLEFKPFGSRACHISPPCYACENSFLGCDAPGALTRTSYSRVSQVNLDLRLFPLIRNGAWDDLLDAAQRDRDPSLNMMAAE